MNRILIISKLEMPRMDLLTRRKKTSTRRLSCQNRISRSQSTKTSQPLTLEMLMLQRMRMKMTVMSTPRKTLTNSSFKANGRERKKRSLPGSRSRLLPRKMVPNRMRVRSPGKEKTSRLAFLDFSKKMSCRQQKKLPRNLTTLVKSFLQVLDQNKNLLPQHTRSPPTQNFLLPRGKNNLWSRFSTKIWTGTQSSTALSVRTTIRSSHQTTIHSHKLRNSGSRKRLKGTRHPK